MYEFILILYNKRYNNVRTENEKCCYLPFCAKTFAAYLRLSLYMALVMPLLTIIVFDLHK